MITATYILSTSTVGKKSIYNIALNNVGICCTKTIKVEKISNNFNLVHLCITLFHFCPLWQVPLLGGLFINNSQKWEYSRNRTNVYYRKVGM